MLDAGCGEGVLVEEYADRLAIEGIDPNYSSDRVRNGSLTALPFPEGTFDRALCSMFGAEAVELVAASEFGKMVAFTGPQIGAIKISDAIRQDQSRASRRESGAHCARRRYLLRRLGHKHPCNSAL